MPAAAPAPQPLLKMRRTALRRWLGRLAPPSAGRPDAPREDDADERRETPSLVVLFGAALVLLGLSVYLAGAGSLVLAIIAAVTGLLPASELAARLLRAMTPADRRRTDS